MVKKFLIHLLGGFTAEEVRGKSAEAETCKAIELERGFAQTSGKRSARELVDFLALVSEINHSTLVKWKEVESVMYDVEWNGESPQYSTEKEGTLGGFLGGSHGTHYRDGLELWVDSNLDPVEVAIGDKTFVLSGNPDKLTLVPKEA